MQKSKDYFEKLLKLNSEFISEKDVDVIYKQLIKYILEVCHCDAGFLFTINEDYLGLEYCCIKSKQFEREGFKAEGLFPISYLPETKKIAKKSPVQASAINNEIINLDNIYSNTDLDLQNLQKIDEILEYSSNSLLSLPITGRNNEVLAVLVFINAMDEKGKHIPFTNKHISLITDICVNLALLQEGRQNSKQYSLLLESFIEVVAKAIDYKSPYTGVHCQRVPIITRMITTALIEDDSETFKNFNLSEDDWYALHIASWLHDCGKVTTPEYILDKATKLETIYNRIHEIRNRFEILLRDLHIEYLKNRLANSDTKENLHNDFVRKVHELEDEFEHVARCNTGDVPLNEDDIKKLDKISEKTFTRYFSRIKGLSWAELNNIDDKDACDKPGKENLLQNRKDQRYGNFNIGELHNLKIQKGTINNEERAKINDHIVMTIEMLNAIPFPKHLDKVVEYAGGHHERMDGKGYPNGLRGEQMSIPTRAMAIADIFEALTSVDRPYKTPKKLSQVLSIMQEMKNSGHIDPDIYEIFVKSKVYLEYAKQYLLDEQIDDFDDEIYL